MPALLPSPLFSPLLSSSVFYFFQLPHPLIPSPLPYHVLFCSPLFSGKESLKKYHKMHRWFISLRHATKNMHWMRWYKELRAFPQSLAMINLQDVVYSHSSSCLRKAKLHCPIVCQQNYQKLPNATSPKLGWRTGRSSELTPLTFGWNASRNKNLDPSDIIMFYLILDEAWLA